ncbi:MAG TPA: glycosyltransferase family 9 protein [Terriglobia bacterium]|nr:glycosyltransferase family 9 protein [Terriglobia bacterium]
MASSFPDPPVKILAIRFARLGDVILLLPALRSLKAAFPGSRLTFLTGHRCAPVANLCPEIDEVIAVDRVAMRDGPVWRALRKMVRLVREIRRNRFDLVVDFHSFRETNLLTWVSGAPVRVGMKRYHAPYLSFCFNRPPVVEDKSLHVAEMFRRVVESVMNEPSSGTAKLVIPEDLRRWAGQNLPDGPKIALYTDAPVRDRVWPPERFAAVADFAVERLGATVLVFSGEEGSGLAERVRKASRIPARLLTFTGVTIPQLAALIASTQLLVSNDTGPMHLGPALGIPTLGLFSVGYPEHFRPTGPADRFLRANPIDGISVTAVIEAVDQMWSIADPGLRR